MLVTGEPWGGGGNEASYEAGRDALGGRSAEYEWVALSGMWEGGPRV